MNFVNKQRCQQISQRPLSMTNNLDEQTFFFSDGKIRYSNTQQNKSLSDQEDLQGFSIHNYVCSQEQNKITKVTQIIINNQKFILKDEYFMIPEETLEKNSQIDQAKISKNEKNSYSRRYCYGQVGSNEKPDTKNLTKNIISIFANWMRDQSQQNPSPLINATKNALMEKIKSFKYYNKRLLYQLAEDSNIGLFFLEFSRTKGEKLIEQSKIQDKASHKKALHYYCKIFDRFQQANQEKNGKGSNSSTTKK